MLPTRMICEDTYYLGANDRRISLFENVYPVPRGVSYNAYLVTDSQTVLFDGADEAVADAYFRQLGEALHGRKLDYFVVSHMEPDHSATVQAVLARHPEARLVLSGMALSILRQFSGVDYADRALVVCDGQTLSTGRHTFSFHTAPMVHWPEVIVSFDQLTHALFCADAFGTFGALSGNLFADEYDFEHEFLDEARRYYANIVGKYGMQVQALLKKAATLPIGLLCPLHGPIWRKDLGWFLDKYQKWSLYEPEVRGVLIAYGSIYGHTRAAAEYLAERLADLGVADLLTLDVSRADPSELLAEAFKRSHIVLASSTYNAGLFPKMEAFLLEMKARLLRNRAVAFIENGSWSPAALRVMQGLIQPLANIRVLGPVVTLRSAMTEENRLALDELAKAIAADLA